MSVIVWSGTKKCSYKINVRQTEVYRTADGLRVNITDLCPLVILQDTQVQWPALQTLAYKVHFISENRCLELSWSTRTRRVSKILLNPQVRKLLVQIQRQIIQPFLISSFLTSVFRLVTKLSFGFAKRLSSLLCCTFNKRKNWSFDNSFCP